MAPIKPMLADIELPLVQRVEAEERQALAQHEVPALEGDFLQGLGRRASRVTLAGVMTGPEAGESLKVLREKFRAAAPVSFVADIATATRVDEVVIEELGVRELAGRPERFEYAVTLREFVQPPANAEEQTEVVDESAEADAEAQTEEAVEGIAGEVGRLEVHVTLTADVQDFTGIVVLVEKQPASGERVTFLLEEQVNGVYSRDDVPAGEYTVRAFRR